MTLPRKIAEMFAKTGRMIREDDRLINEADYMVAERLSNLEQMGRDGTLFRSFFQGSVPAATTYTFVIDIPPETTLYGIARFVSIEAGDLRGAFFKGGTFQTVDEVYPAFNFDNRAGAPAPTCQLKRVSGVSGLVQQSPNSLLTAPTTGPQRRPSTQTQVGAQVVHDSNNLPFFTMQNDTVMAEDMTLYLFWQEVPTSEL